VTRKLGPEPTRKRCGGCGQIKAREAYGVRKEGGPVSHCRECIAARERAKREARKARLGVTPWSINWAAPPAELTCLWCQTTMPIDSFPHASGNRRRRQCRPCISAEQTRSRSKVCAPTEKDVLEPVRQSVYVIRLTSRASAFDEARMDPALYATALKAFAVGREVTA
jgi:hypothetical protein